MTKAAECAGSLTPGTDCLSAARNTWGVAVVSDTRQSSRVLLRPGTNLQLRKNGLRLLPAPCTLRRGNERRHRDLVRRDAVLLHLLKEILRSGASLASTLACTSIVI